MSSLREIKDRIGSVRSTLKITNAMKLVSSAKLRKAQQAIEALRPYEATLSGILAAASHTGERISDDAGAFQEVNRQKTPKMTVSPRKNGGIPSNTAENDGSVEKVAVVTVASNSSLCGSFNGNVLRRTLEVLRGAGGLASAGEVPPTSGVRPSDSPHHPFGTVPPLPDRGCHVPQG